MTLETLTKFAELTNKELTISFDKDKCKHYSMNYNNKMIYEFLFMNNQHVPLTGRTNIKTGAHIRTHVKKQDQIEEEIENFVKNNS